MKRLNWALRLCKPEWISEDNCYYTRGFAKRDCNFYFSGVWVGNKRYHSIK